MATYTLEMRDDGGSNMTTEIEADDLREARALADEETADWVRGGDWGEEGACIQASWTLIDEDGDKVRSDSIKVDIDPDHDTLIRRAGGDPDCDHDWTSEGEGGCSENPGVWSTGGTSLTVASHCRTCGLHKTEYITGSQRNPEEHDEVTYRQPETWCAECQSAACTCEPDEDEEDDEDED